MQITRGKSSYYVNVLSQITPPPDFATYTPLTPPDYANSSANDSQVDCTVQLVQL